MNMKKHCYTLSFPFELNYGCNLQGYALREAVRSLGIPADIFVHELPPVHSFPVLRFMHFMLDMWRMALLYVGWAPRRMPSPWHWWVWSGARFRRSIGADHDALAQENAPSATDTRWIVGSDQVWRKYLVQKKENDMSFYFLGRVPEEERRRSISYAASFGTYEWEGTPEETKECARLLRQFKAVSVREHSGVRLCQELFGVSAVQMPDPTLLLLASDYEKLMEEKQPKGDGKPYVAAYLLQAPADHPSALKDIAARKGLSVRNMMPSVHARLRRDRFPMSVGQWLRTLRDAECLVTDSFHGCIFAIIFNKPFICLGSRSCGNARFDTLMETFHLESRMLEKGASAADLMETPIDWAEVNAIHDAERERGLAFLRENLLD